MKNLVKSLHQLTGLSRRAIVILLIIAYFLISMGVFFLFISGSSFAVTTAYAILVFAMFIPFCMSMLYENELPNKPF